MKLLNNVRLMTNPELIGLAKNRFLPEDLQLAIAKTQYRRGQVYLAENTGLAPACRDYLWSDACNRGYSLKATLLAHGQYTEDASKYEELYERYPSAWSRSSWRMSCAFFGTYWNRSAHTNVSSELLNRIYDEQFNRIDAPKRLRYHHSYEVRRLANHPNVDLKLAIKLSQSGDTELQKIGFEKIVDLS